jgi:hypothetical protein
LGITSAIAVLVIGMLYVGTILLWIVVEASPREPIGDPFLAVMEVLTIASALALLGLALAIASYADHDRRVHAVTSLVFAALAAGLTTAVHFVQLTAVRQLWRADAITDYRLIWPSALFAVEYLVWDLLIGLMMICGSFVFRAPGNARQAQVAMVVGGLLCVAGLAGPLSGQMILQNIGVVGYAVVLPIAAVFIARTFGGRAASP